MMNNDRIQSLLSSSIASQNNETSYQTDNDSNIDPKYQQYNHMDGLLKWNLISYGSGSAIPPPRSGAASVVVKGRLYMFGVRYFELCFLNFFCVCFLVIKIMNEYEDVDED